MKKNVAAFLMMVVSLFAEENLFEKAGAYHHIDPRLLWSVAKIESKHNPLAVNKNSNGTIDIGIMQINSVHLPKLAQFGVTQESLFDPEVNIYIGAWILKGCVKKHGYSKDAITCYNGRIKDNPYADKVIQAYYEAEKKQTQKN